MKFYERGIGGLMKELKKCETDEDMRKVLKHHLYMIACDIYNEFTRIQIRPLFDKIFNERTDD
jgi:hypothetical protein